MIYLISVGRRRVFLFKIIFLMKCIFFIVIVVGVVGNHHEMTFNNPLVNFTDPPLLSLYQQSHDFKQEAYSHGGDADVRVCGLCIVLSYLV